MRQDQQAGSPDEIAYCHGLISAEQLAERAVLFRINDYGSYLHRVLKGD